MNFDMVLDGQSVVKIDVDLPMLAHMLQRAFQLDADAQSTPATETQMRDLLSRIDQRSGQFLREIAASDDGSITWVRMRTIFGIANNDWSAYSGSFGKGMTRAYRNILNDKTARLVWWIDANWDDWDDDMSAVYIDGAALVALRSATKN